MSKLITNTIRHTGGSADNITLDNSQNVTCESNLTVDGTVGIQNDRSYAHAEADQLIIGNYSTDAHQGMTILSHTSKAGTIYFGDGDNPNGNARGTIVYNHSEDALKFGTAGGTERLRIGSSGFVGIGTSSPATLLNIKGTDTAYSGDIAVGAIFQAEDTSGRKVQLVAPGSTGDAGVGTPTNHDLTFFTGNTERMRIDTSGNTRIWASGADAIRSLRIDGTNGSSEIQGFILENDGGNGRLNLKYGTGGGNPSTKVSMLAGGGLTFNGDTAAANALDDYEEGTFTPKLGGTNNAATYNITGTGSYTKIGNTVHVIIRFHNQDLNNSASGNVMIYDLPFTGDQAGANNAAAGTTGAFNTYNVVFATQDGSGVGQRYSWYISHNTSSWRGLISRNNTSWADWGIGDWDETIYLDLSGTYRTS